MLEFKPVYKHDCSACQYLGHYETFDLYFCSQGVGPTIVARKSAAPSDYSSGIALARSQPMPPPPPREEGKDAPHNAYPMFMRALRAGYLIARDMGLVDCGGD